MLYLPVALIWLVLAVFIFAFPDAVPARIQRIPYTDFSIGWICVILFVWRMIEWRLWRQRMLHQSTRPTEHHPTHVSSEYNPDFDFTKDQSGPKSS